MNTNTTKNRYIVFSKKTFSKTGAIKASRKFATREQARQFKRSQENGRTWGIYDIVSGATVR